MRRSPLVSLPGLATVALLGSLALLGSAGTASRAQDSPQRKTLRRPEEPVVVLGASLPRLKGVHKDRLRLYAVREGRLAPIPFQLDERTPEGNYCWTEGPDPVKDVDEGRVDDDDELVFMASDAGDRAPADLAAPAGAGVREEIELADPRTGEHGWVYAYAFADSSGEPPVVSERRYVTVERGPAGATFRGTTFEVASPSSSGATGRPEHIRLRDPNGVLAPEIVRHAARARFHASYLFVHMDRDETEARVSLGTSSIQGPVRIVAPVALEAYLVWGNWVTAVRSVLIVYRSRWEQHARFSVPVNLDASEPSSCTLALEASPGAEGLSFLGEKNPRPIPLAAGLAAARLETSFSSWNAVFGPAGGVVARLHLDPRLAGARNGLVLEPASGDSGARVGFRVDLTGLRHTDEGAPYAVDYTLAFVPGFKPGDEAVLVDSEDAPLVQTVR